MWQRLPICFELVSPLHIGFLPKSSGTVVAPTRPYVPGKNLWGAVTASIVGRLHDNPKPSDFAEIGADIRKHFAFSYCYLSDGQEIFTPSFESGDLRWGSQTDLEFRGAFLDSRLSTQISATGAASDGSLHEIEFIRCRMGSPDIGSRPIYLCGAMWVESGSTIGGKRVETDGTQLFLNTGSSRVNFWEDLLVGGERNYGFGRIRWHSPDPALIEKSENLWPLEPTAAFDLNRPLLGHCAYRTELLFKGQIDVVAGREYPINQTHSFQAPGASVFTSGHFFTPGTILRDANHRATFNSIGHVSLVPIE